MTRAIKGFDGSLKCRGFQLEVGKTYTHDGEVKAGEIGFHAVPADRHPLGVFDYYPPAGSRWGIVEVGGKADFDGDKIAAEILTVVREVGLRDLTLAAVEWVMERARHDGPVAVDGAATASGDRGAATASGTRGAATASGTRGAATASGDQGAATASGGQGAATASGTQGAATASGDHSVAMATGQHGCVKASSGGALFAVERSDNGEILSVACGIVGQTGIKADTWYRCNGGKLVEDAP